MTTFTPARRALAAAVGVNLAGVLPLFLTGAMSVQIGADLQLNASGIGLILAGFAGVSFLMSAPVGARVGRVGITRAMRIAGALSCVALLGCALAPNRVALAAAIAVAGFGNAFGQTASNAMVAARVPEARFGLAYAIKQSAIPLSIMIGGLAVPLIALTVSWRAAYGLACLGGIAAALFVPSGVEPSSGRAERPVRRQDRAAVILLGAGLVAAVVAATSIGAHAASSAVAVGFSPAAAGLLVAAGGAAGLAIRLLAGARADRVTGSALMAAAALCVAGGIGWLLMSSLTPVLFVVGLLMANAFGWGWPGLVHLAVARRFPDATAAASGITQSGVALGLLIGPPLIGTVAVEFGWTIAWICSAVAALTGAVIISVAHKRLAPAANTGT